MLHWLSDQAWVAWSYLSLNLRKSRYRLMGARGAAPCQSASDSGKAFQTRCEACFVVRDARQFKRVCPVLQVTKGSPAMCGVDASQVRPYWGKAFRYYGTVLLFVYLLGVSGAFVGMRSVGYRVSPLTLAWPGHWGRLRLDRAEYFYRQGLQAYRDKDVKLSLMDLTEAYELNPYGNEEGLFVLAQLTQISFPSFSNELYARLAGSGGSMAAGAVEAWARSLVSRGDMPELAVMAESRLEAGDSLSPIWTHAMVFAYRRTADPAPIRSALASQAAIPPDCRAVLQLTLDAIGDRPEAEVVRFQDALERAGSSFERFEILERLIDLGQGTMALQWANDHRGLIASRELACVILDGAAVGNWEDLRRRELRTLLREPMSTSLVNLVVGHLVRHPDQALTEEFFEAVEAAPPKATAENYSAYTALFCLAGVEHSEARMDQMLEKLRAISGTPSASLEVAKEYFLKQSGLSPVAQYLPAVQPLSLEVSYALLRRFPGGGPAGALNQQDAEAPADQ